jgi:hypothetical protein
MKVQEIVTRVKAAIDELKSNADFVVEDESNLTRIIIESIGHALQYVVEHAALEKLNSADFVNPTTEEMSEFSIGDDLVGRMKLPARLLRIVEARLSSWPQSPVPVSGNTQVALMQQDQYARGSWDRPVTILTKGYLKMYCAMSTDDTLELTFVEKPDTSGITTEDMNYDVKVPTVLESSLVYQTAGLTMTAFREELATSLFTIAAQYLGKISEE